MQGFILGAVLAIGGFLGIISAQLDRIEKALKEQHAPKQVAACKLT
jgi:hypothetical protein